MREKMARGSATTLKVERPSYHERESTTRQFAAAADLNEHSS
jgi:hypothetical protein